jgi:3-phenylpropionate/trans-cinnamate dioxygenase ferredoxin reductase component
LAARSVDYLLIGGGIAALSCAEELRAAGADGSIVVVGREEDPPYERPPLSKGYLAGASSREDAFLKPPDWWDSNEIELLTRKSVMKLDADERVATLPGGEELRFGSALLGTGANVRRLRVDGTDNDGIHYLRAFGNADAIRADAADASRVVLVGGSWIGCEVAATLAAGGRDVSLVMLEEVCCENHLGAEVGRFVHTLLESHGVDVHPRSEVERFEGSDAGRVSSVVLSSGESIECGCVVIGAGVVPDVLLARSAGLELGERGGFLCSASLETSVPGVFAAGDAAEWDSPLHGRHARVEHFEVAAAEGRTAARAMLGQQAVHDEVPYFWSDLADWATLEYVGIEVGTPVVRGSIDAGDFTAIYVDDGGRVVGAATVGGGDDLEHAKRLITERATPERAALGDEGTDLASL